jgi:hypothetical protein
MGRTGGSGLQVNQRDNPRSWCRERDLKPMLGLGVDALGNSVSLVLGLHAGHVQQPRECFKSGLTGLERHRGKLVAYLLRYTLKALVHGHLSSQNRMRVQDITSALGAALCR